jgi:hypothetical protein
MKNVFEYSKKGISSYFNNPRIYTWLVLGAAAIQKIKSGK